MKINFGHYSDIPMLHRLLALMVSAALVAGLGCSRMCEIPISDIDEIGTGRAQVVTKNGYIYEFEDVFVRQDSLVGTYSLTEERLYKDGSIAYVDVDYETILPVATVSHLEVKKTDVGNTILLGAGVTLLGLWVSGLDDTLPPDRTTGPYKPPTGGIDN